MKGKKQKTTAQLKKKLWVVFSRYIRLRDAIKTTKTFEYAKCCTCNNIKPIKEMDAGHFVPKGRSNRLRFDEQNVNAQCVRCNQHNHGEQDLYAQFIEREYGRQALERLRAERWMMKKDSRPEIIEMTELYKQKLRDLIEEHGSPWK